MKLFGTGMMITFTEVAPDLEDEFNEWYNREHLDERIDLPGFRRARRYEAIDAGIRYMSTYECLRPEDIGSPAYLDVVRDQTEWSARIMPAFTKWHRMVGRVVADSARGSGAFLALARVRPDPSRTDALAAWLAGGILDEVAARSRLTGACAMAVVREIDDHMTRAFGQEPDPEAVPEWGVLIEGTDIDAASAAAHELLGPRLAAHAAQGTAPVFETWRFLYGNQRLSEAEKA
jgi:hypothetical protein